MMTTLMIPVTASGDAELVNASLAGNREAFGQIVWRYQSLVCSLAYSATGSLGQSEDLAQETFLAAWKHLAELREPAKLRAWLCGIARNLINNSLRTQGREPSHRAESLDEIPESHSPEPLPVERAIRKEEAEILWRSLERIPETYREPLVLFYREHQSIEAVAINLELTEESVRQRLSRGRKLLQEEVLAFVEGALERTAPGKAFTVAVVAALPIAVTSAKAASVGVAVAKGGAGAKSVFSLGALSAAGSLMSMLGAMIFSWRTMVDDSQSPRERKFMVRMGWYYVAFVVVPVVASWRFLLSLSHRPWVIVPAFSLLVLAYVAYKVMGGVPHLVRRMVEIRMEEGTFFAKAEEAMRSGPGEATRPNAVQKAIRLTIPFLLMYVGVGIALPWKLHWLKCAVVMLAQALLIFCFFRRTLRQLSFQIQPSLQSRFPLFMQNRFIRDLVNLFRIVLLVSFLLFFLYDSAAKSGIPRTAWLDSPLCFLLAALVAYAPFFADEIAGLFFAAGRKILPRGKWLPDKSDLPFRQHLQTMTRGPDVVAEMTYAPLFGQLNLGPDQRAKLKDLVLKRTMVGVHLSGSLMNWKLDVAKRTALTREFKSETDGFNAQIKEFLGGENYAAFQQFERTILDRTMLNLFNSLSAKSAAALSPEQEARLLQALTKARSQHPWTTELSRRNQDTDDFAARFTEDNLNTFAREEEQFDRQFLTQAQQILNPEQLAPFEELQQRQRQSQIAQIKLASKLFAPKSR